MSQSVRAGQISVAAAVLTGLILTGCTSSKNAGDDTAGSATTAVKVTLSNDSCTSEPATIAEGPAVFTVTNSGGSAVSEAELVVGTKIMGEKEGLTPGLSGKFSLNLKAGAYEVYCPHAKTERTSFTVTGAAGGTTSAAATGAAALLKPATDGYRTYITQKAVQLQKLTVPFVAAVKAGNVTQAKALYAKARAPYEAIEPVAESFGDLDPQIDARQGDVPAKTWGGYHRIEYQLWTKNNTTGMAPVATKLLADVKTLIGKVETTTYQPADLANGATDLLTEVAKTKLAGEEERYSKTDLTDIDANLEGSQAAFDLLAPALKASDAALVSTIQSRFASLRVLMQSYVDGTGNYVLYSSLTKTQIRALVVAVDALAEPLAGVGEKIVAIQ